MEKIIPTVGLGTATEYDIPLDKVETEAVVEMDSTTKIASKYRHCVYLL